MYRLLASNSHLKSFFRRSDMYNFLLISSTENANVADLNKQVSYLQSHNVKVTLLMDPSEIQLIETIRTNRFDCAYVHIKRRLVKNTILYDPVKVLEYYRVPIVGNHYKTQLMIADKCLTSLESGMGLPSTIVTREMWLSQNISVTTIKKIGYPVIIKPNSLHASQGLSQKSIVQNEVDLMSQITHVFQRFSTLNEILVEKFLEPATEYTVSVLGNSPSLACSVTKLVYKKDDKHHIYDEENKLLELEKRDFSFEIETDHTIRDRLESHAKALFRHFRMKDFGRFDFIVGSTYYLLEANCCPVPGNSFSWEWQQLLGLQKQQVLALFLCSFHFGQVSSGRADGLPFDLIANLPQDIINQISFPLPIDVKPECTGTTSNCKHPQLFTMNSRVGSETEVHAFLKALTYMLKPRLIVETGTYEGNGTIAFAEGVMQNGFGRVVSLEWNPDLVQTARHKLSEYPVEVVACNSLEYNPEGQIDLLFLDSKRTVRINEFLRFRPFLHNKSVIVWHDSSYRPQSHVVFDAVNELYNAGIIDRLLLPTPRGITLSMLKEGGLMQ